MLKSLTGRSCFFSIVILTSIISISPMEINVVIAQEKKSGARRPVSPESYDERQNTLSPFKNPTSPVNCEIAGRYIDDAISRTGKNPESSVIFIIRPGITETSAGLSNLRLKQIGAYMYNYPKVRSVIAIGDKVEGNGKLDIYVMGELLYVLPLHRNKGLNLLECIAV